MDNRGIEKVKGSKGGAKGGRKVAKGEAKGAKGVGNKGLKGGKGEKGGKSGKGSKGGKGGGSSSGSGGGDWTCPSCNFSNFASRSACMKCSESEVSAGAAVGDGSGGIHHGGSVGGGGGGGSQLRRFFDRAMKDKDFKFQDTPDADKFLRACSAFEDDVDLLFRLTSEKENGESLIRYAVVRCDVEHILLFLEKVGSDQLAAGVSKGHVVKVLEICFKAGLTEKLLQALEEGASNLITLSWYVLKLAACSPEARADCSVKRLKDILVSKKAPYSKQIKTIFGDVIDQAAKAASQAEETTIEDVRELPGSRHDNDLFDFRSINVVPTMGELNCVREPYLPPLLHGASEAALLDRQFRLLREDFVGPMRESFQELQKKQGKHPGKLQHLVPIYDQVEIASIEIQPNQMCCLEVSFRFPSNHPAYKIWSSGKDGKAIKRDLIEFWQSKRGGRVLPRDSILAIVNGKSIECIFVVKRPVDPKRFTGDLFDSKGPKQTIGITLSHMGEETSYSNLLSNLGKGVMTGRRLIQAGSNFFSYAPVLLSLQRMTMVPLADELVHGLVPGETSYLGGVDLDSEIVNFERKDKFQFDSAQKQCLQLACSRRVALIQGPPGTGKTHLGVRIADIVYRKSNEKILCLCYTNHALDDFLEGLITQGISNIVRIGGRASPSLEPFNLRELARAAQQGGKGSRRTPDVARHGRQVYSLRSQIEECEEKLRELNHKLSKTTVGANWWRTIGPFLYEMYPHFFKEFVVPSGGDGFDHVGTKGKKIDDDYFWKRWLKGQDRGALSQQQPVSGLWTLTGSERHALKERWETELFEDVRQECSEEMTRNQRLNDELRDLYQDKERKVLQGARVIGCTTTGAAKYKDLLDDAGVTVVIIEEAGEVLEAHALTSLHDEVKHFIMIGDHKQLRPKLEKYSLAVGSRDGHNFNKSLFERLIEDNKLMHGTLTVQHRMRPEISALIKGTYPDLVDGPGTLNRAPIRGLRSSVIFIDHNQLEDGAKGSDDDSTIKSNAWEVEMVVSTVRYLIMNGYTPSQLVVLTPYLGQLYAINAALASDDSLGRGILSDRDEEDLVAQGIITEENDDSVTPKSPEKQRVRVATVDNYQGEEADIVIASLVRCNPAGSIGFLSEPERVNVLLSRARDGEIIIGSASTLCNASNRCGRDLWKANISKLKSLGMYFPDGLPARCETHKTPPMESLTSRAAFDRCCVNGGCELLCGRKLPCGHVCPLKCHLFDHEHTHVKCTQTVVEYCDEGHLFEPMCGEAVNAARQCETCKQIEKIKKAESKRVETLRRQQAEKKANADKKRAEAEVEQAEIHRRIKALEFEREAVLKQTLAEIETMKLKQELELNEKQQFADTVFQAAEAREAAGVAMEDEQRRAEAEAERKTEEARKKLEELHKKSKSSANGLSELEKQTAASLMNLELEVKKTTKLSVHNSEAATQDNAKYSLRKQVFLAASSGDALQVHAVLAEFARGGNLKPALGFLDDERFLDIVVSLALVPFNHDGHISDLPQLEECIRLVNKRDFFSASKILQSLEGGHGSSGMTAIRALSAICLVKLGSLNDDEGLVGLGDSDSPLPSDQLASPLWLLAKSLCAQKLKNKKRAYLLALAAVMHPALSLMPVCAQEALEIICINNGTFDSGSAKVNEEGEFNRRAGQSRALRKLLNLTGCKSVKEKLLDLKDRCSLSNERGDDLTNTQLNAVFTGNPGTGKTTVARIYGEVLTELGLLPSNVFEETTGAKLKTGGASLLNSILKNIRDDGISPILDGERVETDARDKNVYVRGKVIKSNTDGSVDVKFDDSKLCQEKNIPRDRVRSLEKGGVLFVDEAYQLEPSKNQDGALILDMLLTEMEEWRGKLVVVFAGYKKPLEDLFAHNVGLPSRFNSTFEFEDFTDTELTTVLLSGFKALQGYTLESEKHVRIAARRLGRQRGQVGFGNARAVRNFIEKVQELQSARLLRERRSSGASTKAGRELYLFRRDDLLGPRVTASFMQSSKALKELNAQIGLEEVKESVAALLSTLETNSELEENEGKLQEVLLNRLFVGNPGTGKTTVAKIYGQLLKDLGLLSKGDVLVKNPSDFIGAALGESEKKTRAILESSVGCVLLIDEAYGLNPASSGGLGADDPYKKAVVDTIVAEVQGVPGDDRCVIMCGYTKEMEDFVRCANPGLRRRFQVDSKFRFEDYNDTALYQILQKKAAEMGRLVRPDAAAKAVEQLSKERMKAHFGNGGAVVTLLSLASERAEKRLAQASAAERAAKRELVAADFAPKYDVAAAARKANPESVLDGLVGCAGVREQLADIQAIIEDAKRTGRDPMEFLELNFKMVGPPGTGKTTVARRMGLLFEALGVLADGKTFVQCSASDLTTGYVGQAAMKTRSKFEEARGGVLFIDEAYRLLDKSGGTYMKEVVDEIVNLLTEEDFKGKMVVIFAGYEGQVEEMLKQVNPGLRSRVTQTIRFKPFDAELTAQLLHSRLHEMGKSISASADCVTNLAARLVGDPDFASGRSVETWCKRVVKHCAKARTNDATGSILASALIELISDTEKPPSVVPVDQPREGLNARSAPLFPERRITSIEIRKEAEENPEFISVFDDGSGAAAADDDDIAAALQKACVDLGYDKDLKSRQELEQMLAQVEKGSSFDLKILDYVCKATGANESKVDRVLRTQVTALLRTVKAQNKFEIELTDYLEALEEQEREKQVKQMKAIQCKLMGICPAGFQWHREGSGWRCGGGAHLVSLEDPMFSMD